MSELRIQCTACGIALKVASTTTAKKIKCGGCGFIMPFVQTLPTEVVPEIEPNILEESSSPAVTRSSASTRDRFAVEENCASSAEEEICEAELELAEDSSETDTGVGRKERKEASKRLDNPFRSLLLVLLAGYFPFLAALTLGLIGAGIGLIVWGVIGMSGPDGFAKVFGFPGVILGVFLILTALHVLLGLTALLGKIDKKDEFEIELPEQWQEGLVALVKKVADERDLPMPDVIRLHAVDVAHVYQDGKGRSVLVIGGVAVVALPRKSLAGIVAHELGHFGSGDTALSRMAFRWHLVIDKLERRYAGRSWHIFNPLTWVLRLYHWTYILTWFASQRRQELAADQHEIELVGKKNAAATLVLVNVLGTIRGTDLASVAESFVQNQERLDQIFAEQVRRIRSASNSIWQEALNKALKSKTGWLDSHPCFKDRLAAFGVPPKKALRLAMDLSGEPATALFANWPLVEKFLTRRIVDIVRDQYFARKDYVETVRAIMRAGERR
jgi:Zn-dependent protease with chaperone function